MCPRLVSFLHKCCAQNKWTLFFESKCEDGSAIEIFNRSVKQEPKLNVVLPEDPRTRRRRLYKLASEPKPKFPYEQKNFYSQTVENKEIIKSLASLSTCTNHIRVVSINWIWLFLPPCNRVDSVHVFFSSKTSCLCNWNWNEISKNSFLYSEKKFWCLEACVCCRSWKHF